MFRAGTPPRSFGGRRGGHRRCCKRPASVHVISVHGCSRFYIIRCKHNSLRDFIAVGDFGGWAMMMPCHISGVRWTVRKSFLCVCVFLLLLNRANAIYSCAVERSKRTPATLSGGFKRCAKRRIIENAKHWREQEKYKFHRRRGTMCWHRTHISADFYKSSVCKYNLFA